MRVTEAKSDGFINQADARQIEAEYKYPCDFAHHIHRHNLYQYGEQNIIAPIIEKRLVYEK